MFLKSKIFLIIAFAIVCLLGFVNYNEHKNSIASELKTRQLQLNKIQNKYNKLKDLSEFLKTNTFLEREARQKLNKQKLGEKVVIIAKNQNIKKLIIKNNDKQNKLMQIKNWIKDVFK